MMPRYDLFGLTVESSRAFPGFLPAADSQPVDVTLRWVPSLAPLGSPHAERRHDPSRPATLVVTRDESAFHFAYEDGTSFLVSRCGRSVSAVIAPRQALEDTLTYFTGPILGFLMALRGIFCLHASAVLLDGVAVAFIGAAGAGKSTTAALLHQQGLPVISDDALPCVLLDGVPHARSSYPRLRLWEDSVTQLAGKPDALPLLTPNWNKRYLPLDDEAFASGTFRLALLVFLDQEATSLPTILRLTHATYVQDLIPAELRSAHFALMGALARSVPTVNLGRPRNSQEYLALLRNTLNATRRVTMG